MNVTIVGCGNIGTQFAVHCAVKQHRVSIYCSKPEVVSKTLTIVDSDGKQYLQGDIHLATKDESLAFSDADLIFVTVPAFAMNDYAKKIIPHLKKGAMICLTPGTGGAEFAFKPALQKGCTIIGIQRVPSVARLTEYGKTVCASGYRDELFCAAIPSDASSASAKVIEDIFDIKCTPMPNYLNVTLTPSNPL